MGQRVELLSRDLERKGRKECNERQDERIVGDVRIENVCSVSFYVYDSAEMTARVLQCNPVEPNPGNRLVEAEP